MKFIVITFIVLSMSGCELNQFTEEGKMQEAVLGSLKDPDSAKFGKMTKANESNACLTVNAKNSMGGYTGDQQAYLIKSKNKWEVLQIDGDLGHDMCIKILSEIK